MRQEKTERYVIEIKEIDGTITYYGDVRPDMSGLLVYEKDKKDARKFLLAITAMEEIERIRYYRKKQAGDEILTVVKL